MKTIIIAISIILALVLTGCTTEKPIGGEKDEHGCLLAAGYIWCESKEKCLRTWEEACPGMVTSFKECAELGYPIMESYPRQCRTPDGDLFVEEIEVPKPESKLTIEEAMTIAEDSECTEKGYLTEIYFYNENSHTWWVDLKMKPEFEQEICNPACVVNEADKTAEINWRCTGALLPE